MRLMAGHKLLRPLSSYFNSPALNYKTINSNFAFNSMPSRTFAKANTNPDSPKSKKKSPEEEAKTKTVKTSQ